MDLFKIDKIEIFAAGKWNGLLFTEQDLHNIAATFSTLHENHKVPLKFGHNDEQPMTDGYPALGWIDKVWVENGVDGKPKLFAALSDVPKVVYDAIAAKRYRKPSIELDIGVEYKGKLYKYVLSGVALLGADLPAVSTLADLSHYMERAAFSSSARMSFSAYEDKPVKPNEEKSMSITKEEMEARLEAERAKFDREQAAKDAAHQAELDAEKAKVVEFEREKKERAENEAKAKVKLARDNVTAILEDGVKKFGLTPAKRDSYRKLFGVDDDARVVEIDIEDLKNLIGTDKREKFGKEHAGNKGSQFDDPTDEGDTVEDTGDKLDFAARKIQRESGGKLSYSAALEQAMRDNIELASAHILATEKLHEED